MEIKLNESLILSALNRIGVKNSGPSRSGWITCLCPYHQTDRLNSGINIRTGAFSCFSCKVQGKNIIKMVMDLKNLSFKDALDFIGLEVEDRYDDSLKERRKKQVQEFLQKRSENENKPKKIELENLKLSKLEGRKYLYTRERDFNKDFVEKFSVSECKEGWYKDYLIIPIVDKELGIKTFEARRLKEINYLLDFFNREDKIEFSEVLSQLKKELESYCSNKMIVYKNGYIYQNGEKIENEKLLYLLKPKVLYPGSSEQKNTIFNRESLNIEEDLYISEGTGTLPKLYQFNQNSTCLFGTSGSKQNEQLKILQKVKKKKIIIPNYDFASYSMIWKLSQSLDDVWVLLTKVDDTHKDFSNDLRNISPIRGTEFVLKALEIFN